MSMIQQARDFAKDAHSDQMYGIHPYFFHLESVRAIVEDYGQSAQIVGLLHDVLEDTDVELGEIQEVFGAGIAMKVALVSDPEGSSRKHRKAAFYARLAYLPADGFADVFIVKLADRLSHFIQMKNTGDHKMLKMYLNEHEQFKSGVYRNYAKALQDHIEVLVKELGGMDGEDLPLGPVIV